MTIACFNSDNNTEFKIKGTFLFTQEENKVKIEINLSGLTPNHKHCFNEAGDLSDNCKSACAHFNPYNKNNGCPGKEDRHVGNLGNLKTDSNAKLYNGK